MRRQVDKSGTFLSSRQQSPAPVLLAMLLLSTGLLLGCETAPSSEPAIEGDVAGQAAEPAPLPDDKDVARVKPYVEDADAPSSGFVPKAPLGSAVLGAGHLLGSAMLGIADWMDPSHVGRHVYIYEVDRHDERYLGRDALLPPGPRRLGVKHCTSGAREVYCSRLVTLEFEAEAGRTYDLLLLGRKKIILRDIKTERPVAWGDVEAITAEAYRNCVMEAGIRDRRRQAREAEDGYVDEASLARARRKCREVHPASYQQSLAPQHD